MLGARERTSEYVFPSTAGSLRSPNNFRTQWRAFREAHRYADWVVPYTFRKAVATLVAAEAGVEAAGRQLAACGRREDRAPALREGAERRPGRAGDHRAVRPALTQR